MPRKTIPGLCLIAAVLAAIAHAVHAAPESIDPPPPPREPVIAAASDEPAKAAGPAEAIVPLVYDRRAAARKPRKTTRES